MSLGLHEKLPVCFSATRGNQRQPEATQFTIPLLIPQRTHRLNEAWLAASGLPSILQLYLVNDDRAMAVQLHLCPNTCLFLASAFVTVVMSISFVYRKQSIVECPALREWRWNTIKDKSNENFQELWSMQMYLIREVWLIGGQSISGPDFSKWYESHSVGRGGEGGAIAFNHFTNFQSEAGDFA